MKSYKLTILALLVTLLEAGVIVFVVGHNPEQVKVSEIIKCSDAETHLVENALGLYQDIHETEVTQFSNGDYRLTCSGLMVGNKKAQKLEEAGLISSYNDQIWPHNAVEKLKSDKIWIYNHLGTCNFDVKTLKSTFSSFLPGDKVANLKCTKLYPR